MDTVVGKLIYNISLQDMRTGFGDSISAAAEFSKAVLGVTNDLSSFSNIDVDETFGAIRSGLSGQFEALQKLGVGLNVAIIDQGRYAASIGKSWQQMSNLEKQEAVLSGIMERSRNATRQNVTNWREYNYELGDAVVTADSVAGEMEALTHSVRDVGAEFGATLLPHVSTLLDVGQGVVGWADDLTPAMKELSIAVAAVGGAFKFGGVWGAAIAALSAVALAIVDARDRTDELAGATERLEAASRDYRQIVQALEGDLSDYTDEEIRLLELKKEAAAYEAQQAIDAYIVEQQRFENQQRRQRQGLEELQARAQAHRDFKENAIKATEELEALSGVEAYHRELEELRMTEEERLETQRTAAIEQARVHGASKADLEVINAYYNELIANLEAAPEKAWDWKDWTSFGLDAVQQLANAFDGLNQQVTTMRVEAIENQMNAELAAMGLLEAEEQNKYTSQRPTDAICTRLP